MVVVVVISFHFFYLAWFRKKGVSIAWDSRQAGFGEDHFSVIP